MPYLGILTMSYFDESVGRFIPYVVGDTVTTTYGQGILISLSDPTNGKATIQFEWGTVNMRFMPQAEYIGRGEIAVSFFRKALGKIWTHVFPIEYELSVCSSDKRSKDSIAELHSLGLENSLADATGMVYYIAARQVQWASIHGIKADYGVQIESHIDAQRLSTLIDLAVNKMG